MEKKNNTFLNVVALLTLLVAVIGTTFAYLNVMASKESSQTKTNVVTANLIVSYKDGATVSLTDMSDEFLSAKQFTVTNDSNYTVTYQVIWSNVQNKITNNDLVYNLTTDSGANNSKASELPKENGAILVSQITIEPGKTHTYTLDFNFDGNSNSNESFVGTLQVQSME